MSPFDIFANDIIDILKPDGAKHSGIKANVARNIVSIFSTAIPVDRGDIFIRHLPHERTEEHVVEDPGYVAGFATIQPHYAAKVRRR